MKRLSGLLLGFLFAFPVIAEAQHSGETSQQHNSDSHGMKGAGRLTLGLGHTHVSEGEMEGRTQWIVMPSWSLNYDYWLSDKWALGLQSDLILESFFIETPKEELIERKFPFSLVPVGIFKPGKHLSLFGGVGGEFSSAKNLVTTRLGFEYSFHIPGNWEVGATALWDGKWDYYNSWGLAFTFSKIWPHK